MLSPQRNTYTTMMPEVVGTSGNEHTVYELGFKVVAFEWSRMKKLNFSLLKYLGLYVYLDILNYINVNLLKYFQKSYFLISF